METKSKSIEKVNKPEVVPACSLTGVRQQATAVPQGMGGAFGVQSAAGNLAVQRMFRSGMLQAKLAVGNPNDPLEHEADQVAEQVVHAKAEPCHCGGSCADCQGAKEGEYQRATKSAQKEQPKTPSSSLHQTSLNRVIAHPFLQLQRTIGNQAVLNMLRSGNMQIDPTTQALIASRFGHDFSQIPVYSLRPSVLQAKLKVNQPGDVYEQEADQVAEQVMRMTDKEPSVSDDQDETKNSLMHKQSRESEADTETDIPSVPPVVRAVLSSGGGQPLDATTRAFMEPRFGHDFSHVRVHTDERAAESARAVNALAYTVGRDVVFGVGQYAPGTLAGQSLIAHELAHTMQQRRTVDHPFDNHAYTNESEREADAAMHAITQGSAFHPTLATYPHIARQAPKTGAAPTPTTAAPAVTNPLTRAEFEKIMMQRYRVKRIRTGTFQEEQFGDMQEADWHTWDPGVASSTYTWIVEAFQQFEATFGGTPPVEEIDFLEIEYRQDPNTPGHAVKLPGTISSYHKGQLIIYSGITRGLTLRQGTDVFTTPTAEQAVHRNIAHELGHGIAEISLGQAGGPPGQDPTLFTDYRRAVGWTAGSSPELYDIQAPGVEEALENGTPPPANAHITPQNWDRWKWKERPLTSYMADNPSDDFAEAITAYVNEPSTLQNQSPARYKFIDDRKSRWGPAAKKRLNIWERVKQGGQPRTLEPSRPSTIWERATE